MWEQLQEQRGGADDLERTTPLYGDLYLALEIFHMPLPQYIARTTPQERLMYQLFLGLKALKERHVQERMMQDAKIEREMDMPGGQPTRGWR